MELERLQEESKESGALLKQLSEDQGELEKRNSELQKRDSELQEVSSSCKRSQSYSRIGGPEGGALMRRGGEGRARVRKGCL